MENLLKQLKKDSNTEQFKLNVQQDIDNIKKEFNVPTYKSLSIKLLDKYLERLGIVDKDMFDWYDYGNIAFRTFRPYLSENDVERSLIKTDLGRVNVCTNETSEKQNDKSEIQSLYENITRMIERDKKCNSDLAKENVKKLEQQLESIRKIYTPKN